MRAYVVGAEKRRPVLNILQRRRFCAAVNKEQEEITGDTLPASPRPCRPDAIPLCRCCASGRADRAAAPCADPDDQLLASLVAVDDGNLSKTRAAQRRGKRRVAEDGDG